jgi:ubiquinone/menaquinone biosynthesis C-methylase UbiE
MSSTIIFYNLLALVFDFSVRHIVRYRAPDFLRHHLLSLATSKSNILDIGTGTGHAFEAIYRQRQFASIHGVDTSAEMLRRCRRKFPDIHLHEGDVFSLPDDFNRWFHLIICMGAVEHIPDLPRFFV